MNERTIFLTALDIIQPDERSAYLDRVCGDNTTLRQQVDALLLANDSSGEFLEVPALQQMAHNPDVTQTYGEKAEGDEFDLSYLTPSAKPGSLGTLGHYEVMQVLGQGGFGTVLKAFDEKLHRVVAIKVLSRQLASTSPPRKRFLREARAVAAIKHENVVQVYSVEEQPLPYLVMEFVDGSTLQERLNEAGPLGIPEILHIGQQIAAGLAAAHALGLVHRDIKPANILMEKGVVQKVKITDFGLARTADDASLTQSGTITGTPLYMAPEQAKGAKLDPRADLFSLGSVLYALACGHPPFRAPNTIAVLRRVAEDTPRPLQEIIPEVPDWFVAIVDKLLAKNPAERFQSAQEVADLLGLCQSKLQAGVTPTVVTQGLSPAQVQPAAKAEPIRKKFPVVAVAAGVMVMFTVMAAGLFFLNKNKGDSDVAVVQPTTPVAAVPATTDPDRKAAEYVLSIGGVVQVNGQDTYTRVPADLPSDSFKLTGVDVGSNQKMNDEGLAILKECKHLARLFLRGPQNVTDEVLANFKDSKSLTTLGLSSSETISDKGLANFKNCENLTYLSLAYLENVTDAGLTNFKDRKNLTHIELVHCAFSDKGMANFVDCNKLTSLNLQGFKFNDQGLAVFKGSKSLTALMLALCENVTDAGLANFKDCKKLYYLYMHQMKVSDVGLAHFKDCKNISRLELTQMPVSDAGLAHFKDCSLSQLMLANSQVSDAGLANIKNCKYLLTLDLAGTQVSDAGLANFKDSIGLVALYLTGCEKVTDVGLTHFKGCSALTNIGLQKTKITAAKFEELKKALPKCRIESDHGVFEPK